MRQTPQRRLVTPCHQVLPVAMLADVLNPMIRKLNSELEQQTNLQNGGVRGINGGYGATTLLAERCAPKLFITPDGVCRRLYEVTHKNSQRVSLDFGDAVLLALGSHINDVDVPVLAPTRNGAQEMVDAAYFGKRKPKGLVRSLQNVSRGFLEGLSRDPEDIIIDRCRKPVHARAALVRLTGEEPSEEDVRSLSNFCKGYHEAMLPDSTREARVRRGVSTDPLLDAAVA